MIRSPHSNDSVLDMTNTGKALIIALVLVDVGFIAYQLLPKADHSEAAPDAVTANSAKPATVSPRADGTHMSAGNVVSTSPSANSTGENAAASVPLQPALIANNAQAPARPQTSRHKQSAHGPATAQTREPATANTDATQPNVHARDALTRHGSNAVAAAMTEQLVKESSKPDPSLPMPPQAQTQPQIQTPIQPQIQPQSQTAPVSQAHRGANPVGAAMTEELVRESARVTPASQAPAAMGTQ